MKNKARFLGRLVFYIYLIIFVSIFLCSKTKAGELKEDTSNETQIIEKGWMDTIKEDINILKNLDFKGAVGGVIIRMSKDNWIKEPSLKLLESPKKYLNLNIIWPDVIGVSIDLNLKKIGGDIYFKYIRNIIDEEARQKIEEKYKWLQWIRIDVGYVIGVYDNKFIGRFNFKVVEWNF